MAPIKTFLKDAVGPASVPTKASHGGVTSEPTSLPGMTKSSNCPAVIMRDGAVTGSPKASGPVKTQFKDAVS